MTDGIELMAAGLGGATVGGVIIKMLTWSAQRNIAHFDQQVSDIKSALLKLEEAASDLRKEVQHLREANIGYAEKLGANLKDMELLRDRVDKLAEFWQREFKRKGTGR